MDNWWIYLGICSAIILVIHITFQVKERMRLSLLVLHEIFHNEHAKCRIVKLSIIFAFLCIQLSILIIIMIPAILLMSNTSNPIDMINNMMSALILD